VLQACLPGVTVVLPIQGYRSHSLLNWQSQLSMRYAGPVEYIFVTQSAAGMSLLFPCLPEPSPKFRNAFLLSPGASRFELYTYEMDASLKNLMFLKKNWMPT